MKKILAAIMAVAIGIGMAGCSKNETSEQNAILAEKLAQIYVVDSSEYCSIGLHDAMENLISYDVVYTEEFPVGTKKTVKVGDLELSLAYVHTYENLEGIYHRYIIEGYEGYDGYGQDYSEMLEDFAPIADLAEDGRIRSIFNYAFGQPELGSDPSMEEVIAAAKPVVGDWVDFSMYNSYRVSYDDGDYRYFVFERIIDGYITGSLRVSWVYGNLDSVQIAKSYIAYEEQIGKIDKQTEATLIGEKIKSICDDHETEYTRHELTWDNPPSIMEYNGELCVYYFQTPVYIVVDGKEISTSIDLMIPIRLLQETANVVEE